MSDIVKLENDGKTPMIKINTMEGPAQFFNVNFNLKIQEIVQERIKSNNLVTGKDFHLQACNAQNVIYIDIDYHSNAADEKTLLKDNYIVLNLITEIFIKVNRIEGKIINKFMFMPENLILESGGYKCGGHAFIYLNENFNKDLRIKMYNDTKSFILSNTEIIKMIEDHGCQDFIQNFDQVFDQGPIIGMNTLLPFAEKLYAKRHYILMNPEEIDLNQELYIIPVIHMLHRENTVSEENVIELNDEFDLDIDLNSKYEFGSQLAKQTVKFIESLQYLSPYHKFWKWIADHNSRYKKVCKPLLDWLIYCEFIDNPLAIGDGYDKLPVQFATIITPLVKMTNKPDETPNNLSQITKDIYSINMLKYRKQISFNNHFQYMFNPKMGAVMQAFYQKNKKKIQQELEAIIGSFKDGLPDKTISVKDTEYMAHKLYRSGKTIFINFMKFVGKIMKYITEEIRPFKSNPKNIFENIREGISFDEYFDNGKLFHKYNQVIKLWCLFSVCECYFNCFDSSTAIRQTLESFTKYFIFYANHQANPELYIYNIRQTRTLRAYPYNQWIKDNAQLTIGWILNLANQFMTEQLKTQNKDKFINPFLKQLSYFDFNTSVQNPSIDTFKNITQEIKNLTKDISFICSAKSNSEITPKSIMVCGDCPYFPMRNGILEFITKETENRKDVLDLGKKCGDIIFHYNNFGLYLDGYTNVEWNEDYNYKNPIYEKVDRTFREIYPHYDPDGDTQVCDYVKMMFAQTLHSVGSRDQIHQFYGSGGEGKSLINNALLAMLGSDANTVIQTINHKDSTMINPYGLGVTISARGLITSNKTSHDSGGLIEAKNKRFMTLQEPDTSTTTNMNVSVGKQLTSESTISGRQIYRKAESFQPKLYITIQTNQILGYSEDTDAVTRRYGVIFHRAKFVTSALRSRKLNSKFVHQADASLNDSFNRDPRYWEALFRVLLPYAQKFIREDLQALSNIDKPKSMDTLMNISKRGSSGLLGWFLTHIVKSPGSLLSLQMIIGYILNAERLAKTNGDGSIFDSIAGGGVAPQSVKVNAIIELLNSKFGNSNLYKLKEYFKDPTTGAYSTTGKIDGQIVELGPSITEEQRVLYFEEYSIPNINVAIEADGRLDYNSIYLIDYEFKEKTN